MHLYRHDTNAILQNALFFIKYVTSNKQGKTAPWTIQLPFKGEYIKFDFLLYTRSHIFEYRFIKINKY